MRGSMKKTDDDDFVTIAGGRLLKAKASPELVKSFRTFKQLMFVLFCVMVPIALTGVGQLVSCKLSHPNWSWDKCVSKLHESAFDRKDDRHSKK